MSIARKLVHIFPLGWWDFVSTIWCSLEFYATSVVWETVCFFSVITRVVVALCAYVCVYSSTFV